MNPLSALANARRRWTGGARPAAAAGAWHVGEEAIMGTAIRVELWSEDLADAEAAIAAVMAEMHRIDAAMSPHKETSELSRINRDAARAPVALSAEIASLVARAIEFSAFSDGAFDITYAAVGHLHDYRAGSAPLDAQVAPARAANGCRQTQSPDGSAASARNAHPLRIAQAP